MIQKAERPMILAGGGVISANASEELQEFAKLINAPVATSLMGKGSIPEDDESAIGMLGMHGREVANQSVNKSDVLIAIGCRFSDRTTGQMESFVPDAKVIHIDIDPAEIGKNIEVDLPIVGDAKIILSSLIEEVKSSNYKSNSLEWLEGIKAYKKSAVPRVSYDDIPLKPQQVIKEIANSITDDTIVTTDVGVHQLISWILQSLASSYPLEDLEPWDLVSLQLLGQKSHVLTKRFLQLLEMQDS